MRMRFDMGTLARWKSILSRKRFIWPVETRLRRSAATRRTVSRTRGTLRPSVAEICENGAEWALEDGAVRGRLAVISIDPGAAAATACHEVPFIDDDNDAA